MNKKTLITRLVFFMSVAGIFFSCSDSGIHDYLKQGFINPPDSARPGVYWYFMDGNLDRDAMTADLESMKKAGIGYVLFLEVNVGVPRGKVDFLSEEWQELYKHAVKESERLGIRLVLGSGPGWAGSGGPWINPAKSMMHLVASDTTVSGPAEFNGILSVPKPKKPYFGERSLTQTLTRQRNNWYQDVVVLAFPTPRVSLKIARIDEKALYYRAPYTSQPGVFPYLPAPAEFQETVGSAIDESKIIDLSGKLREDGSLQWKIPDGKWTIMRFGKRNNGAVTRPAPAPGLGFECDKFDTVSFDYHYNSYVGKLISKTQPGKSVTGGGWTMIHIDSWEMGSQNWSPHFREEFKKRRGYDPLLFLPVYSGFIVNSSEMSERFLWDVRQTSNEQIVEYHAGRFKELGRRNGFRLSIEPYDMNPAADLDLGSVADVPMCEFWSDGYGFNSSFSCFEATSVAHVKGVPVVGAESFTAAGNEAWKQYPGIMKNQGDWAFCVGINRMFYHTFSHKPFPEKYRPGMTMGPYGVHWDRGQTWWPMAEGYHKYITRCQYLLSQGKAVADILYLTPEGAPQVFLPPASALEGTAVMPDKRGYSFDGCSPLCLIKNASVKKGRIVFPGGGSYRIMVLPDVQTMTPELVSKIGSLVQAGATVIGNPPVKSPSLVNYPECDQKVKTLAENIWGKEKIPWNLSEHTYGSGKIWWGKILKNRLSGNLTGKDTLNLFPDYQVTASLLSSAGIKEDFISSGSIRYTHRSMTDRDVYFISNRTEFPVSDTCIFRDGTMNAEIWNPVTAEIIPIGCLSKTDGTTSMFVKLDAFQSYFVVFHHRQNPDKNKNLTVDMLQEKQTLFTLEGPWNVTFDTTWGGPAEVVFDSLTDWSKMSEDGIRYYSGIAVYRKSFDLPGNTEISEKSRYFLDLGKLKNMGRVKLNGMDLGILWTSPFQADITDALKIKDNQLEIEVANLWINRLIGDETQPWDGVKDNKWPEWLVNGTPRPSKRYTFTTHHFYKKDDPLSESGLIGPVSIQKRQE
ncbi:MAG: glycosyl hydrolase [Bacteroidales bacterium]|nr:glycosyl hydrolase [Bacteroidales bacterium]